MANEVRTSDLISNGGLTATYLSRRIHQVVFDATDLRVVMENDPVDPNSTSTVTDVTKLPAAVAASAASSEISGGFSNSAFTTAKYQHTPSRYALLLQNTDLVNMLRGGIVNVDLLIMYLQQAIGLTYTDVTAALFTSLSTIVGTAGDLMDSDTFMDGTYALNLANVGNGAVEVVSVLHNKQINELRASLRGETGAMQWQESTAEMIQRFGPGYVGRWAGVSIFQSDSVPSSSSNRRGAMFRRGCFRWQAGNVDGAIANIDANNILARSPEAFVERVRDGANAMTSFYLNMYPSVVETEDALGVSLRSLA